MGGACAVNSMAGLAEAGPSEPAVVAAKRAKIEKGKVVQKAGKKSKRPSAPGAVTVRRRKRKVQESFAIYVYKVLKQIHPECGISKRGMQIMNSFMTDIFDRMATESTRLLRLSKRTTLTSREMETAVRLMLPGELSKHAISEGT